MGVRCEIVAIPLLGIPVIDVYRTWCTFRLVRDEKYGTVEPAEYCGCARDVAAGFIHGSSPLALSVEDY
jgi:hypothetical protein